MVFPVIGSEWYSQDWVASTSEQSSRLRSAITVCCQELDSRESGNLYQSGQRYSGNQESNGLRHENGWQLPSLRFEGNNSLIFMTIFRDALFPYVPFLSCLSSWCLEKGNVISCTKPLVSRDTPLPVLLSCQFCNSCSKCFVDVSVQTGYDASNSK